MTTQQTLHDIFVTALEGGIGYWSAASAYHWSNTDGSADLDGFYAVVHEVDTDTGDYAPEGQRIDAAVVRRGLRRAMESPYPALRRLARDLTFDPDEADYDAADADAIVQLGLWGEIVYG